MDILDFFLKPPQPLIGLFLVIWTPCSPGGGAGGGLRGGYSPHPQTWDTTGYSPQAGGTHPTGMISCLTNLKTLGDSSFIIIKHA